jgi:hypothetical protein
VKVTVEMKEQETTSRRTFMYDDTNKGTEYIYILSFKQNFFCTCTCFHRKEA